jgi:hypothetical protein
MGSWRYSASEYPRCFVKVGAEEKQVRFGLLAVALNEGNP